MILVTHLTGFPKKLEPSSNIYSSKVDKLGLKNLSYNPSDDSTAKCMNSQALMHACNPMMADIHFNLAPPPPINFIFLPHSVRVLSGIICEISSSYSVHVYCGQSLFNKLKLEIKINEL